MMPITPRQVLFLEKSPVNSTAFCQSSFYSLSVPEAFYLLIYQLKSSCQRRGNNNVLMKQHICIEVKGLHQSNTFFTLFQLRHAGCEAASCGPGGLRRLWEVEKQVQLYVQETVFTFLSYK